MKPIWVSPIGFIFDLLHMVHARSTLIGISLTSLMLFAGCASSPSRTALFEQPDTSANHCAIESDSDAKETASEYLAAPSASSDELVIGTEFSADSVPVFRSPIAEYTMSEIQAELEAMYDLDQLMTSASSSDDHPATTKSTIHQIDLAHSVRLKEIVDHIGWPTRELVGLKATQAAYMVIQHCGEDIAFQNRCLELIVDLVAQGELPASYVALLTDRIRVFQGEPQVFGTQMEMAMNEHGIMIPTPTVPIEDPENLDDRRKLMGMPMHGEFIHAIELAYEASQVDVNSAFAEVPTDN